MAAEHFRVGRHLGRTIYRVVNPGQPSERDVLIGMMDTPELGAITVRALNELVQGGADLAEIDRNARAYGWEVGHGQPISPEIVTSPDNPFMEPGWQKEAQIEVRSPFGTVEPPRRGRT